MGYSFVSWSTGKIFGGWYSDGIGPWVRGAQKNGFKLIHREDPNKMTMDYHNTWLSESFNHKKRYFATKKRRGREDKTELSLEEWWKRFFVWAGRVWRTSRYVVSELTARRRADGRGDEMDD